MKLAPLALSAAVAIVALGAGGGSLVPWVANGTNPGARGWLDTLPLLALGGLAAVATAGAFRRAAPTEWALGLLAWALSVQVATELRPIASSHWLNDGPALVPLYLVLGAALGLYAIAGPRAHGFEGRAAVVLAIAFTSNGKMWMRAPHVGFALLAAGALLLFAGATRRRPLREVLSGEARWVALIAAGFLAWTLLAALLGDSPARSLPVWGRCLAGVMIALALACCLDDSGARRVHRALLVGLAAALSLLAVGLAESAARAGWGPVLASRLRLFDQHANGTGPLFAMGIALTLAPAVLPGTVGRTRALALFLLALCVLALWRTESRASYLGALLGAGAVAWVRAGRLPRRPLRWGAGAVGLALVAVLALVSPAGAPVRERLDDMAQGPSALGQRWHFWRMATAATAERPLLGWGPNTPYVHARFAPPSYYDGTAQDLHAHDLWLAAAEGTGWVGLALLLLLVLATLEVGRRAIARGGGEVAVGMTAALLALLGCNLLDLGQSETTFVPSFLWIVLGTCAAVRRPDTPTEQPASGARAIAGLLLLVPLAAHPACVRLLAKEGRRVSTSAAHERADALPWFERALDLQPLDADALRWRISTYQHIARNGGQPHSSLEAAVDDLERATLVAPGRAQSWDAFAEGALELGLTSVAVEALDHAETYDPRGVGWGKRSLLRAWAHLQAARRAPARDALVEGIARGATGWSKLPHRDLPRRPQDPPGARRVVFLVADGGGAAIPMTQVLDSVVDRALQVATNDPVDARRLLGHALSIYRSFGLAADSVRALERYEAAGGERLPSTVAHSLPLLVAAGQVEDARAVFATEAGVRDPRVAAGYAAALLAAPSGVDPTQLDAALLEAEVVTDAANPGDLFFEAGGAVVVYDMRALLALRRGDGAAALAHHDMARFDRSHPVRRVEADDRFLAAVIEADLGEEVIAAALDRVLADCSLTSRMAREGNRMLGRARLVRKAGAGGSLLGRLGDHGAATETFRAAWLQAAGS